MGETMISDRQKLILKAIVEEYVITNEPVGSKLLTNKPYLKFSSATLRYDMQHLEETGYLEKTHTSSGRVPSEVGLRFYVENLLTRDESVKNYYENIEIIINDKYLTKEQIINELINYVAKVTGCFVAVVGSNACYAKVKKMEIVPLNEHDALLLIVTNSGVVRSQRINVPKDFKMEDLLRIMSMFDVAMYDQYIYEIRDILEKEASKPRIREIVDYRDDILNFMIKGFASFLNNECYKSSMSPLFAQPEFKDYKVMQRFVSALDNTEVSNLIYNNKKMLSIKIGKENEALGLADCAIISIPYYLDLNEYGQIIAVGPVRTNYQLIVPILEYLSNSLPKLYK